MHSIFDCQKAGMPQKSAFDTYGELEEITDEPYILDRDADSSESEDDQICKEMAKYNRKLKEESFNCSFQAPVTAQTNTTTNSQYGRPPFLCSQFSTSNSVHHRFRPVRSITPEEDGQEEMLPEVVNDKNKAAILNSIHFQQLFKGNPVPVVDSSAGYGRPPSVFLQKPIDSIHTQNGKQADQREENCMEKSSSAQKTAIPSASMIMEELEPIFKASTIAASFNQNIENETSRSDPTCSAPFSSHSKVLDAILAKAKPMNQVLDKKWEVSDVFDENIDWNGMTAVDWSLDKANNSKLTTSPSPKKKGPEINWDLEEETKKHTKSPENSQVESNKPQEVHFFFDLNLDSTAPNDFERNQSQQQTQPSDSTQPRSYSSLTHMPMPNLLNLSSNVIAESGKERKDADIPPFIDLSEELKKGKQLGSPTNVSTGAVVNKVDNKIQSNNDSPSDKDTINEKKQKILYMAAAISMATMAASEGVLRLSKLEKIVSSVFGGHAKPELYGHKDWLSFINQHCRKNIQVIQKSTHEAVLICITSDEETS